MPKSVMVAVGLCLGPACGVALGDSTIIHSGVINEPLAMDGFDVFFADLEDTGNAVFEIEANRNEDPEGEFSTRITLYAASDSMRFVHQTRPFELESLVGRLGPGTVIGPVSPVSGDSVGELYDAYTVEGEFTEHYTEWRSGTQAYVGFSFVADTTGERHFGWLELKIDPSGDEAVIVQWAWESQPDQAILAGDAGEGPPPPPEFPVDQLSVQFDILREDRESGVIWLVFPYLTTTDSEWLGQIRADSPTGTVAAYINHPESVIASSSNFSSLQLMRAALTGTWTVTAEVGVGEVELEFDVDATGIEESAFPLFSITSPARQATVGGAEFSAVWSQPAAGSWTSVRLLLSGVLRDDTPFPKYSNIANEVLAIGQTSYQRVLEPGEKRVLVSYVNAAAGLPGMTVGGLRRTGGGVSEVAWNVLPATRQARVEAFFFVSGDEPPGADYGAWAAGFFDAGQLADPAVGGPFATPNGDSLANVAKYALGFSSPFAWEAGKLPQAGLTQPDVPGGPVFPTLSFTLRHPLLGYEWRVEAGDGLTAWRYNGDGGGPHFEIAAGDNGDGTTTFTARSVVPLGEDPLLMRLRFLSTD